MRPPILKDIKNLENRQSSLCISVYLRLEKPLSTSLRSNTIKLKNLIRNVSKVLEANKSKLSKPIEEILIPLHELLENESKLWDSGATTLAVFVSDTVMQYFFLTEELSERFRVAEYFYLEPLQELLQAEEDFYILSVSHEHVSLYEADKHSLRKVRPKDLPAEGVMEALNIDELPFSLQFHPTTPAPNKGGRRNIVQQFHGHYNESDTDKQMLTAYFRKINEAVCKYLRHKKHAPLIFAGVKRLFPLYKSVNSYDKLYDQPIEGNYENIPEQELHKRALAIKH